MKSKLRWAWLNLSDTARKACEEAVKHLEDISHSPVLASPNRFPVDTLPPTVDPFHFSTETLLSPAKEPEGEFQKPVSELPNLIGSYAPKRQNCFENGWSFPKKQVSFHLRLREIGTAEAVRQIGA